MQLQHPEKVSSFKGRHAQPNSEELSRMPKLDRLAFCGARGLSVNCEAS